MKRLIGSILGTSVLVASSSVFAAAIKLEPAQIEFFEKKVRPVLIEHCYKCHSSQPDAKIKGDLALDTREGTLKGGQSGPAVVPGNPDKSTLIKAIKHVDPDTAMPPKADKLPDNIIANLEQWVRMGAPDPREATDRKVAKVDFEKAKEHWAFQPVTKPAVPKVADKQGFVQSPIDSFVLAKLSAKGLAPSPKADKRTLIRRITYDLTGLPPTPEEVEAFVKDNSKDAYPKLVDRLLSSKHFGEHWGRLWLDLARYADTTGDRANGGRRNPLLPYAWTYRDYVIEAFNKDLPYDQFIVQQIAADKLPESATDKSMLRALGFITVGKTFMGNENETIDDRIDVISKGLMAFTVSCARCHDHKFDPVTMKDYYGLHGVFASSRLPTEFPLVTEPKKTPEYADFLAKSGEVDKRVEAYREAEESRVRGGMLDRAGDYLFAVNDAISSGAAKGGNPRNTARKYKLEGPIFELWLDTVRANSKGKAHPSMAPWLAYAAIPEKEFAKQSKTVTESLGKTVPASAALVKEFQQKPPASLKEVAAVYNKVIGDLQKAVGAKPFVYKGGGGRSRDGKQVGGTQLADAGMEELRVAFFDEDKGCVSIGDREMSKLLGVQFRNGENAIRKDTYELQMAHPGSPIRAMVLEDMPKPRDSKILIRGEPGNPGPQVPRQFIEVLAGPNRVPFKDGSGRLEMARAIADRGNPLTPRVWVNRVWKNLFGEAIVRTPSDFGVRSDSPTHPEMLNYLASYLMDNGWSTKQLIRAIMLSSTYQQDSKSNAKAMQIDPTNQLLWRMNIRRLPFESIRDTFLMVDGTLDLQMGGHPIKVDPDAKSANRKGGYSINVDLETTPRRTVYGYVDRSGLPEVYRTFDFANPDMSTGERILTTVPQQALFMMNSTFVADSVRHILAREDFKAIKAPEDRIKFLYRTAFQRPPTDKELKLSMDFLAKQMAEEKPVVIEVEKKIDLSKLNQMSKTERKAAMARLQGSKTKESPKVLDAWERYTQIVLLSNEFVFVN